MGDVINLLTFAALSLSHIVFVSDSIVADASLLSLPLPVASCETLSFFLIGLLLTVGLVLGDK